MVECVNWKVKAFAFLVYGVFSTGKHKFLISIVMFKTSALKQNLRKTALMQI